MRIPPSAFWRARRVAPLATLLLPVCRDLPSALAELGWIRDYVDKTAGNGQRRQAAVLRLCRRRGRGEPLQYVLGTQPFGPLDLLCRRGVLIPRPEPEAYGMFLADRLLREASPATSRAILDLCTGTGCLALLLYARLQQQRPPPHVVGIDVSPAAVALARANSARHGFGDAVQFRRADVFSDDWLTLLDQPLDVLVCNPPYVSRDGFAHETARSVRIFEPTLAQVPTAAQGEAETPGSRGRLTLHEDVFYGRLLDLTARLGPRILLCEVGGMDQAQRVVAAALSGRAGTVAEMEIWADCPDVAATDGPQMVHVAGQPVLVRGSGHGRAVYMRRR